MKSSAYIFHLIKGQTDCLIKTSPILTLLAFSCLFLNKAYTQHEDIFPELLGNELLNALREEYKPQNTLSYADARDILYSKILNREDSLSCIYTSYTIYLDPSKNPRTDAFEKGLNAEHLFPRSKGANKIDSEANMYNLFACRIDINNDRGNLPFAELSDAQTNFWYYLDQKTTTVPVVNKERYSRLGSSSFTPPAHQKGDIARAMMYFYTMYKEFADNEDPLFFQSQLNDLCKWHIEDPTDGTEWDRNRDIAMYQDNKANPFILDCTLAERSYCIQMEERCQPIINTRESEVNPYLSIQVNPNPFYSESNMTISASHSGFIRLEIYNLLGQLIASQHIINQENYTAEINIQSLFKLDFVPGVYLLVASYHSNNSIKLDTFKLIRSN